MNEEILKELNRLHSQVTTFKMKIETLISLVQKQEDHCPKCHQERKAIVSVGCHCWMLQTGKITQKEYDDILKRKSLRKKGVI